MDFQSAKAAAHSDDARDMLKAEDAQTGGVEGKISSDLDSDFDVDTFKRQKQGSKNQRLKTHLGHRAHPAVQAVLVKQQARLVRLKIPPIVNLLPLLLLPLGRLLWTKDQRRNAFPLSVTLSSPPDLTISLYAVDAQNQLPS